MTKDEIRQIVKSSRQESEPERLREAGELVQSRVLEMDALCGASTVAVYIAVNSEVGTERIIQRCRSDGKRVSVPVYDRDGNFYRLGWLDDGTRFSAGPWGIPEPEGAVEAAMDEIDLVLVPGVAFDPSCNRLGHGRGYYDRLLGSRDRPGLFKVGLCFDFQLFDCVPTGPHDVQMDAVVSESGVLEPSLRTSFSED